MTSPVLEMRDIVKEYEGNRVLKGVSLAVRPGTIHALVGENGAGKSTLMNLLFGMPVIRATGGYRGVVAHDRILPGFADDRLWPQAWTEGREPVNPTAKPL